MANGCKRTSRNSSSPGRRREVAGVLCLALALFLLLCFFSYNPYDPSFSYSPMSGGSVVDNLCGVVGSYSADALIRFLGASAVWLPVFLAVVAVRLFRKEDDAFTLPAVGGFFVLVFSTSGLLSIAVGYVRFRGAELSAGGVMGSASVEFLKSYLNTTGTLVLLVLLFLVALMVVADLSLVVLSARFAAVAGGIRSRLGSFVLGKMERLEEKRLGKKVRPLKRAAGETAGEEERDVKPVPIILEEKPLPTAERTKGRKGGQAAFEFIKTKEAFQRPPLTLLDDLPRRDTKVKKEGLIANARLLEQKLADFGVEGRVVEVKPGPLITTYELEPAPGVKLNRITNLSEDLAMALRAPSIRIAPITGKAVVGIEIPNEEREPVHLRDVLDHPAFLESRFRLPIALGEDIVGMPVVADLARMPHLLIAGTTGSGKSVSLNAMICSILFRSAPDEVKFLMIDPKRLELSGYEGIPHLLHPVVVDPKDAALVLKWAVVEMERLYRVIGESGVKSIEQYNRLVEKEGLTDRRPAQSGKPEVLQEDGEASEAYSPAGETVKVPRERLPYIVVVIDELADLMMVAQRNVEESLTRLAQMARAAGIHLILATQRPSVDVITGVIKANFPTRISFQVSSKVDSRTILDQLGAEQLLGSGDMLFLPPGTSRLSRIHGAYVSEKEIERVVGFIKMQGEPRYDDTILKCPEVLNEEKKDEDFDEKYDEAVELVTDLGQASISLVQRYMKIGYNRAARIIERMEAEGVVGPSDGVKPRKVLARKLPQ
jgi:S-DNA-T family DNA segregation ATPase FtsK/SpoIIIE